MGLFSRKPRELDPEYIREYNKNLKTARSAENKRKAREDVNKMFHRNKGGGMGSRIVKGGFSIIKGIDNFGNQMEKGGMLPSSKRRMDPMSAIWGESPRAERHHHKAHHKKTEHRHGKHHGKSIRITFDD